METKPDKQQTVTRLALCVVGQPGDGWGAERDVSV